MDFQLHHAFKKLSNNSSETSFDLFASHKNFQYIKAYGRKMFFWGGGGGGGIVLHFNVLCDAYTVHRQCIGLP